MPSVSAGAVLMSSGLSTLSPEDPASSNVTGSRTKPGKDN